MDWFRPIDIYCERTDPGFWAEPLNAASNAAFLLAALAAAMPASRHPPDRPVLALAGLVAIIGIGSFLFHTFANYWSLLADVIPIAIFIHAFLFLALRRFFDLGMLPAAVLVALFFVLSQALGSVVPRDFLNGSGGYLPAWGALVLVGAILVGTGRGAGRWVLAAAGVFTASLAFRSLDMTLCEALPVGVHYMWHMLNAATLYLLLLAALRAGREKCV